MGKLIYFMPSSLDGYIEDEGGNFDWGTPSEEGFAFINELERACGTYLYGRRLYETMAVWQTPELIPAELVPGGATSVAAFSQTWQSADKIVYSTTLSRVSTPKTRLERDFDPEAVRRLKAELPRDISVGGPTLAAHAIRAGLVDEIQLLIAPIILGGGKRLLPGDVRIKLELLQERRFDNGMVYLRYRS